MDGRFIAYYRVSTQKQGVSGLGLEAQKTTVMNYLNGGSWTLIAEYIEIESGKRNDRPELTKAIEHAKRMGATLLVAKLDRLARNLFFITSLMESGVDFVAADMPTANKLTIHILAAMAEYEREQISKRTKEALAAAKVRRKEQNLKPLGNPDNLTKEAAIKGRVLAVQARQVKADAEALRVYGVIKSYRDSGMSLNAIARKMTQDKELTPRKCTTWSPTTVRQIINRIEKKTV